MTASAAAGVVGNDRLLARIDHRLVAVVVLILQSWKWPLAFAVSIGVIDLVWANAVGVSFTGLDIGIQRVAGFLFVGLTWQAGGILLAQRNGPSRWSGYLENFGKGVCYFGLWCSIALSTVILTYLCARVGQPFKDAAFAGLDQGIGFDWLGWANYVAAHPWLKSVLSFSYHSHAVQLMLIVMVAALSGDDRRPAEFFWIGAASVVVTCAVSAWLPAIGARVYFGPGTSSWVPDVTRLRDAAPAVFDLANIKGIVSMPSYHAALAVFFMWSSRRTGIIGYALVALNLVMIVSTLSEGGHYLVDVIAGLALAVATIAVVHRVIYRDLRPA